jgi:hypothetical protein
VYIFSASLHLSPDVAAKWLSLMLHIWEVRVLILAQEIGYPDQVFRGFLQFLQANAGVLF